MKDLYDVKDLQYYANVRKDLVDIVAKSKSQRILEIGAGTADTLLFLKQNKIVTEVVGVDIFSLPGSAQTNPLIDKFYIIDIEKEDIGYPKEYFDLILCGDVIEHLQDPWLAIQKISYYLKPAGKIVISTPNFRNWRNFVTIFLKGRFLYDPKGGLLDKTHLRFFCKADIESLVDTEEFRLESITPINYFSSHKFQPLTHTLNLITFKVFEEFLVTQYIAIGTKK